jgi:pimeloyl-ACP methyl ester carboxylesterase
MDEIRVVRAAGIEGVIEMETGAGSWADMVAANPKNRDRLLAIGAEEFEDVMWRWFDAYVPKSNEPIPGVSDHEFAAIDVPTLIIRGGEQDIDHPKRTSFEIHALIKGSRLIEPPWAEDAWEQAVLASAAGTGNIFDPWVEAAPQLLAFFDED